MVNDYEIHAVFLVIEHQIQENIHFFMKSSLILDPFSTQIKSPTGNFRPSMQIIHFTRFKI